MHVWAAKYCNDDIIFKRNSIKYFIMLAKWDDFQIKVWTNNIANRDIATTFFINKIIFNVSRLNIHTLLNFNKAFTLDIQIRMQAGRFGHYIKPYINVKTSCDYIACNLKLGIKIAYYIYRNILHILPNLDDVKNLNL